MIFTITGANGFLGVHIIHHLLRNGHLVRAIIRPNSSLSEFELAKSYYSIDHKFYANLEWHTCELYDMVGLESVISGSDYVMHLAGLISYLQKDFDQLLLVNQDYTANIVNACIGSGIKKLLYSSSIAAISKSSNGEIITEDREWDNESPHSLYGYSKHLGENELWRGREEGLDIVMINPGIILGFGEWSKGSNKLFRNAEGSFPFYSEGVTGWVGVEDVANIAMNLCLSDIEGERFIVVSENLSFKHISDEMASSFHVKKSWINVKGLLYKIIYALIWLKELFGFGGMLSKETVRASVSRNIFSNTKLIESMKYNYQPVSEVISKSTQSYKNKKALLNK